METGDRYEPYRLLERGHVRPLASLVRCAERFGEPVRGDAARDRLAGECGPDFASGSIASTAARETVKKAPPKRATKLGA